MDAQFAYVRREMVAAQPPPPASAGLVGWMRERLFSGPFNSILTVTSALVLALLIWPTLKFLVVDAVWTGSSRADCLAEAVGREVGACWPFVAAKFQQFMYGFYPDDQLWRVKLTYAPGIVLLVPVLIPRVPLKAGDAIPFFGVFPVRAFFLPVGGGFVVEPVETPHAVAVLRRLLICC